MSIDYSLIDDGTMDTVVECHCDECGKTWEERFDDPFVHYDADGLNLVQLMDDYDVYCECEE